NVQQQLHEELRAVMQSSAMREQLQSQGMEIVASPQAEFAEFFDDEIAKWGQLIVDNNVMAGQ
ncbi:MAG: tripartite tricarboxylate transporter substrate-binding protein, partial [Pigmentiphaga sp.]